MMKDGMEKIQVESGAVAETGKKEEALLTHALNGNWRKVLALAEQMGEGVSQECAEICLTHALRFSMAEIFCRLLLLLPKGDYASGNTVLNGVFPGHDVEMEGSLVMLAAALGKAEQLRALLAYGCDVNGASLDAAERLLRRTKTMDPRYRAALSKVEPYSAPAGSRLQVTPQSTFDHTIQRFWNLFRGATPLAAAVLCGQEECVQILMEAGAWKEEAPSVSRVLMMQGREEDKRFQSCREAVLTYGEAPRPLALWAVVQSIQEDQLEAELERCPYRDEEIAQAVWELGTTQRMLPNRRPWAEERKRNFHRVQILEKYYPHVVRRPELVSVLLRQMLMQDNSEEWGDFLLSLCGERVDLSLVQEGFVRTPPKKLRAFLLRLCEGRTCYIDRDGIPSLTPASVLQTLLQHVEFLPTHHENSVSGLTYAILQSGNLRLIRKALQTGVIPPEESTPLLLQCLDHVPWATTARTLLLTTARGQQPAENLQAEPCRALSHDIPLRWYPKPCKEDAYERLMEEHCPEQAVRDLVAKAMYDSRGAKEYETKDGCWRGNSLLHILCLAGCNRAAEHWILRGPKTLLREISQLSSADGTKLLQATPLCAAAYTGQKGTVEMLLAHGAEADEERMGLPSVLRHQGEDFPITPMTAAMIRGHWEIVRLLKEHGGTCNLEQKTVQKLWNLYQTDDLHGAAKAYLGENVAPKGGCS